MAGKKKDKNSVTPEMAKAWMLHKAAKVPIAKVADEMGRSPRTVCRLVKDFDEFMMGSEEYSEAAKRIVGMLTKACDIYDFHLDNVGLPGNPDVSCASNIFKAAGFLKERVKTERDLSQLTDEEIDEIERRIIANTTTGLNATGENPAGEESPEA